MKFKSDKQRKAVMSQYNSTGNTPNPIRPSKLNQEHSYRTSSDHVIKEELGEMKDFLKVYTYEDGTLNQGEIRIVSLKDDISFKDFKKYFPEYTKKDLTSLFSEAERRKLNYYEIKEKF